MRWVWFIYIRNRYNTTVLRRDIEFLGERLNADVAMSLIRIFRFREPEGSHGRAETSSSRETERSEKPL